MDIKILHMYHDCMNLYGDYGNISVVEKKLCLMGFNVFVDKKSLFEEVCFEDYDFVYIGSGTEKSEIAALEDLKRHRISIISALNNDVLFLATGNSFEMFGKKITDDAGTEHEALGVFDFSTDLCNKRILEDQVCKIISDTCSEVFECVGFINKASEITGINSPLFHVIYGVGNTRQDKFEGFRHGSFYGTHLTGPCLVKNPRLCNLFVNIILLNKGMDSNNIHTVSLDYENIAQENSLKALKARFSK